MDGAIATDLSEEFTKGIWQTPRRLRNWVSDIVDCEDEVQAQKEGMVEIL